jgi:hypothetical protein
MSHFARTVPVVAVTCLAVLVSACSNPLTTGIPTAPSAPPITITETFSGELTVNGAVTHPFAISQAGLASAALTALSPDPAVVIGVSLGTWNGQVCQIILANDNATQSASVLGEARSAGNFCVRVYDVGKLTGPTGYEISVAHY